MEQKKKPDHAYHFPFCITLIGWLLEMLIFGSLGAFHQIASRVLLRSLGLLTVGWWLGMLAYSLLAYIYFQEKDKKH